MRHYAKGSVGPATSLAQLARCRAENALITAAGASCAEELMGWATLAAVQRAQQLMQAEVDDRAGERYDRWQGRQGYRNGTAPGYVVVGGRKVSIRRPRLVDADGCEVELESYAAARDAASMDRTALGKVLEGVACRKVARGLQRDQPLAEDFKAYGASRSSVSRRWIAATESALAEQAGRALDDQRYLAILLDGKGFGDHLLLTALGIDEQGAKRVLGVWEGDSENKAVAMTALVDMCERGLDVSRGVLVVIDGGKGLAAAVSEMWPEVAIVGRCRVHKRRDVVGYLPKEEHRWVRRALERAWHEPDVGEAEQQLRQLIEELEPRWPHAAASLREGLAETLTCQRLGLPAALVRALGSTNLIENALATTESICQRVCRWRNGAQAMRWASMALLEAENGFGRVAGPEDMASLSGAIAREMQLRAAREQASAAD